MSRSCLARRAGGARGTGRLLSAKPETLELSSDGGATWEPFGPPLPFRPAGVVYSETEKALYIWHRDCGTRVLPDAIQKLSYDFGPATPIQVVSPPPAPPAVEAVPPLEMEAAPPAEGDAVPPAAQDDTMIAPAPEDASPPVPDEEPGETECQSATVRRGARLPVRCERSNGQEEFHKENFSPSTRAT